MVKYGVFNGDTMIAVKEFMYIPESLGYHITFLFMQIQKIPSKIDSKQFPGSYVAF